MTDQRLRDYRLARLSAVEAEALEIAGLEDPGFDEALRASDYDLLADWAAGRLTEEDRRQVEAVFPAAQLAIARRLAGSSRAKSGVWRGWWALAAAVMALAVGLGTWWNSRPEAVLVTVRLERGAVRGSAVPEVRMTPGAGIRFVAPVAAPGEYIVRVERAGSGVLQERRGRAETEMAVELPAAVTGPGDYEVLVFAVREGREELEGAYPVRVRGP